MPSDSRAQFHIINGNATISASKILPGSIVVDRIAVGGITNAQHLGIETQASRLFDPAAIYKKSKLVRDDVMDVGSNVETCLKDEMRRMLIEEEQKFMDTVLFGDGGPIINNKENDMSDRQLRTPESPIETKDLTVAGRALGFPDLDYLLDAVALVQSLESNQRLVRSDRLKAQDLGNHVQIVDGVGGVMTDLKDNLRRDGKDAVLDGKMVELASRELLVVTALAN